MIVKDLIAKLQQMDQELLVLACDGMGTGYVIVDDAKEEVVCKGDDAHQEGLSEEQRYIFIF